MARPSTYKIQSGTSVPLFLYLLGKTTIMKKLLPILLLSLPVFASAQALSGDDIKQQFIKDWERSKAYTLDYLNTMPADKYSFKPVDSIRSFAQQMLHLASANLGLVNQGTGAQPSFVGRGLEGRTSAQTKDSVVYYVTASYDYAIDAVKGLDASKYGELAGQGNNKVTRYAWILKGLEHQAHHRGQTTIYIRLQGIRPPNERLF